jgi:hypothetical protein
MGSCEKAALICNKAQYNEASFVEKMKLTFHLFMCKNCSAFTKQNQDLTTLCEKAKLESLTETEKAKMKELLQGKG